MANGKKIENANKKEEPSILHSELNGSSFPRNISDKMYKICLNFECTLTTYNMMLEYAVNQ